MTTRRIGSVDGISRGIRPWILDLAGQRPLMIDACLSTFYASWWECEKGGGQSEGKGDVLDELPCSIPEHHTPLIRAVDLYENSIVGVGK